MEARNFPNEQDGALKGVELAHEETVYEQLNSPELRAKYVTFTDGLISKLAETKTDVAIYLDKSARPVAWLVNELWDTLAPVDETTGHQPKRPEIKFLNIDREQWGAVVGRSEDKAGVINVNRIPDERIQELRQLYAPIAGDKLPKDETMLTGKNVLVIDEVRMSGDTLHMAKRILQRAFPDANNIDGAYWMPGVAKRDLRTSAIIGGEVPVWYSDRTNEGRLVANRDTTKSDLSNSSRQRIGKYWLSSLFREPDLLGRQLKKEVKQLAKDLRSHKIPYIPSPRWDSSLEPVDQRIERIDGINVDEYAELRRQASSDLGFVSLYTELIKSREAA